MFTVSDDATAAMRDIVTQPGVPPGAGLRIVANPDGSSLHMTVAPMPEPGDTVYEAGQAAQLFVSHDAEDLLADKSIDARKDDAGQVQFVLGSRP